MKTSDLTNYDSIAGIYIPHSEGKLSWNNLYERPFMLSLFETFKDKNVFDIGCGSGFYTRYALKQNAVVTAIDASSKMLDHISHSIETDNLKLIKADIAEGLPFVESITQDYIICSLVLHYIEKWEKLISDCYRILKKGGRMYISTHHPFNDHFHLDKNSYFDKYLVHDTWQAGDKPFTVHYYTRSLSDLLKPLIDSQFKIVSIDEPLPTKECKKLDINVYTILKSKPAFLFITLEKR